MKLLNSTVITLLSTISLAVFAGEIKPYSLKEFNSLTRSEKPVVIEVSAPWCPVCKEQKPIIDKLLNQPEYANVTVLTVDFDSEKNILKEYRVGMQSTLIAFKGVRETYRSVGDTTLTGIEMVFKKAVN